MNKQFEYITSVGSVRGRAIHADISIDINNGTVTPITSVFGKGFTPDYPVKTAEISKTISADAAKVSQHSITVVEFKTGAFNAPAAQRQAVRYAFGIHRVSPRATIHIIVIGIDANKTIEVSMTSDEMIESYVADNANRIAADKANNPTTTTVSVNAICKVINIDSTSFCRMMRGDMKAPHAYMFGDDYVPFKVGHRWAISRDRILTIVEYYGVVMGGKYPIASKRAIEIMHVGIDAFVEKHFC